MKRFIGLDVHKTVVERCVVDDEGKTLFRRRIECTRETLLEFAESLTKEDSVALEVTTNAWAVADLLQPFVGRVVVSNPMKTKAIAEAKVKTDKVDAEVLAQLLRCDYSAERVDAGRRRLDRSVNSPAAVSGSSRSGRGSKTASRACWRAGSFRFR